MSSLDLLADFPIERRLTRREALRLADLEDLSPLLATAALRRDMAHGPYVSYSRKVFIPLTQLCRDVCHYCTFARPPRKGQRAFLTRDEVLTIAEAGKRMGCKEALFTLGDKPELRYRVAREELAALGHETTISYLVEMAALVLRETGCAACQSGPADRRRSGRPAGRIDLAGNHARKHFRATLRQGRRTSRIARQTAHRTTRHDPTGR